jgi:hypothetical protein
MDWKFDIDTRSLTNAADKTPVRSVSLAYPDKYPCKVRVVRGSVPYTFTGSVKTTVKPQNSPLALAAALVPVTAGSEASGILSLSTTAAQSFLSKHGSRPADLEVLVLDDAGVEVASVMVSCNVARRRSDAGDVAVDLPSFKATQSEAEAGTNNTKWMTPLRVRQVLAYVGLELDEDEDEPE